MRLKKVLSILLTLIFLFNTAGYFVVLKGVQRSIRKEIKKKIKRSVPASELTLIKLTKDNIENHKNGFTFLEKDKEFRFNKKMYDIVKQKNVNDTLYYYCINDTQEEKLFATLDEQVKQNFETNIPAKQKTNNLLKNVVKEAIAEYQNEFFNNTTTAVNYPYVTFFKYVTYPDVLTPPPESIS